MVNLLLILLTTVALRTPADTAADRVPNERFRVSINAEPGALLRFRPIAFPVNLNRPVGLVHAAGRFHLIEQDGLIRAFTLDGLETRGLTTVLDIRARVDSRFLEPGLLGLAFHPAFKANGRFFVAYSGANLAFTLSEFTASADGLADPDTERILLRLFPETKIHFGGHLAFGRDGYLYVGLGDGGVQDNARDLGNLKGSILRIHVDGRTGDLPYGIPADNPLVDQPGARGEIWAYGFRNPWRFSEDPDEPVLWVGDVGEGWFEEVNRVRPGEDHGWPVWEGDLNRWGDAVDGDAASRTFPVHAYSHSEGVAVIGGFVSRGRRVKALEGRYVFGDFASRTVWTLAYDGTRASEVRAAGVSPGKIASFARGPDGDVYLVSVDGAIFRVEDAPASVVDSPLPRRLSETGLFTDAAARIPSPGIVPYDVRSELWSDGADKTRWLALPGVSSARANDGAWAFPQGAILVKHFFAPSARDDRDRGRIVETRLLVRHTSGTDWSGFSYAWNEGATDAVLLDGRAERAFAQGDGGNVYTHAYPSRADCRRCHTEAAGTVLGVRTGQLDRAVVREGESVDQLAWLADEGLVLGAEGPTGPAYADPQDGRERLDRRARSYLDVNCSHCHRPGGTGRGRMDLRIETPMANTRTIGEAARFGTFGLRDAQLIVPGSPDASVLYLRMIETGEHRMPPLATRVVDADAARVVRRWIAGMDAAALSEDVPLTLSLPFPNPFNSGTTLQLDVARPQTVSIDVFNVLGQRVRRLVRSPFDNGRYLWTWDGRDDFGRSAATGVYVLRLSSGEIEMVRKLVLVR